MHIERTAVPGVGALHHIRPRRGGRFGLYVDAEGNRRLFVYHDSAVDVPAGEIVLEPDEADRLADMLRSRPLVDRLLSLERKVDELIGERRQ